MDLKSLLYGGLASVIVVGCETDNNIPPKEVKPVVKEYIEGKVIGEARLNIDSYPYAFTLKDKDGKFYTFDVDRLNAAGVDSLVDKGDIVKINMGKGVLSRDNGYSLNGTNYVEIVRKADDILRVEELETKER